MGKRPKDEHASLTASRLIGVRFRFSHPGFLNQEAQLSAHNPPCRASIVDTRPNRPSSPGDAAENPDGDFPGLGNARAAGRGYHPRHHWHRGYWPSSMPDCPIRYLQEDGELAVLAFQAASGVIGWNDLYSEPDHCNVRINVSTRKFDQGLGSRVGASGSGNTMSLTGIGFLILHWYEGLSRQSGSSWISSPGAKCGPYVHSGSATGNSETRSCDRPSE
jgi:hypothetical protein